MTFTEYSTVDTLIRDQLSGCVTHHTAVGPDLARRHGKSRGICNGGYSFRMSLYVPKGEP